MPGRRAEGKLQGGRPSKQTLSSGNACKAKRVVNSGSARKPRGVVSPGRNCNSKRASGVSSTIRSRATCKGVRSRSYLPQYLGGKPRPKWHSGKRDSMKGQCKIADLEAQLSRARKENQNLLARLNSLEDSLDWAMACRVSGMRPPPSPTARSVCHKTM